MKTIVFDLDDTIYDEINYVKSGFKAVSKYLHETKLIPIDKSYEFMLSKLSINGRGKIFDELLMNYNKFSKVLLNKCLRVYHTHIPNIQLDQEAIDCLNRFDNYSKYVVTDGNKVVQKNKLDALGINQYIKASLITHLYGIKNSKPSPYCFFLIAKKENVSNNDVVYIGDNPKKDFIGIKPYGFKTIRILKGPYKDLILDSSNEADIIINSLNELTVKLIDDI